MPCYKACYHTSPRACSTKTRIKTRIIISLQSATIAPRACSTKTRIKTGHPSVQQSVLESLREHVPLKQGLRHPCGSPHPNPLAPRACSTKTRIKTSPICINYTLKPQTPRACSTKTRIKTIVPPLFVSMAYSESMFH